MLAPRIAWSPLVSAAILAACSGAPDPTLRGEASEGEPGTAESTAAPGEPLTLARVVIERSESVDGTHSAQAMAHFVEWSASSAASLELVGLGDEWLESIPAGGSCRNDFASNAPRGAHELELLDAGSVEIHIRPAFDPGAAPPSGAVGPTSITLAPHAFPSVSSLASGLVYTTRDRSADALPSDTRYEIAVDGAQTVPHLIFSGQAPRVLSDVTVGGLPLERVAVVDATTPMDLTWAVGDDRDVVVLEFARPDDGALLLSCTFVDGAGAASISAHWLEALRGPARLSVHRMRKVDAYHAESAVPGSAAVRSDLRFDFELTRLLRVVDHAEAEAALQAALEAVAGMDPIAGADLVAGGDSIAGEAGDAVPAAEHAAEVAPSVGGEMLAP